MPNAMNCYESCESSRPNYGVQLRPRKRARLTPARRGAAGFMDVFVVCVHARMAPLGWTSSDLNWRATRLSWSASAHLTARCYLGGTDRNARC